MRAKGLNPEDKVLGQAIALRIVQTMRLKRTKVDGKERRKGVSLWRLLPPPAIATQIIREGT
jgi:hypothetical protein